MTAAQQPRLDLGDYRGRAINDTVVKILNGKGGFHPETAMAEPEIFEMGEELTIAVRVRVGPHNLELKEAKKDDEDDTLVLTQTWYMGTIAVIPDTGKVKQELDAVAKRQMAGEEAAAKAKAAAKAAAAKPARAPRGGATVVSIGDSLQKASDTGKATFE